MLAVCSVGVAGRRDVQHEHERGRCAGAPQERSALMLFVLYQGRAARWASFGWETSVGKFLSVSPNVIVLGEVACVFICELFRLLQSHERERVDVRMSVLDTAGGSALWCALFLFVLLFIS